MSTKKKTKKPITIKKPIAVEVCCSVVKSQQTYELPTVADLIKALQKFPTDAPVYLEDGSGIGVVDMLVENDNGAVEMNYGHVDRADGLFLTGQDPD